MKLTPEEADRLAKGLAARAKDKDKEKGKPKPNPDPEPQPEPATQGTRSVRIVLPPDLWKALRHIAIDLDRSVNEVAVRALQEFVERNREPK